MFSDWGKRVKRASREEQLVGPEVSKLGPAGLSEGHLDFVNKLLTVHSHTRAGRIAQAASARGQR